MRSETIKYDRNMQTGQLRRRIAPPTWEGQGWSPRGQKPKWNFKVLQSVQLAHKIN